jgi:integrase/recombinase XerC
METEQGKIELEDVTAVDLLTYKQSLSHLASSTQKRYMATIRSFFKWAQESGLITIDPAAGVKLPRAIQGKVPTYITLGETETLLQSIKPGRYAKRDLVMLWCFALGLRVAEAAALDVGDVIHPEDDAMPAIRVRGKGSKARTIPLGMAGYKAILADSLGAGV